MRTFYGAGRCRDDAHGQRHERWSGCAAVSVQLDERTAGVDTQTTNAQSETM